MIVVVCKHNGRRHEGDLKGVGRRRGVWILISGRDLGNGHNRCRRALGRVIAGVPLRVECGLVLLQIEGV